VLEASIYEAVTVGDEKILSWQGKVVDKYHQKSDILRIFMLKGLKPQYRDSFNMSQFAGPVQLNVSLGKVIDPLTNDQGRAIDTARRLMDRRDDVDEYDPKIDPDKQ
jgi:hypothetical protein